MRRGTKRSADTLNTSRKRRKLNVDDREKHAVRWSMSHSLEPWKYFARAKRSDLSLLQVLQITNENLFSGLFSQKSARPRVLFACIATIDKQIRRHFPNDLDVWKNKLLQIYSRLFSLKANGVQLDEIELITVTADEVLEIMLEQNVEISWKCARKLLKLGANGDLCCSLRLQRLQNMGAMVLHCPLKFQYFLSSSIDLDFATKLLRSGRNDVAVTCVQQPNWQCVFAELLAFETTSSREILRLLLDNGYTQLASPSERTQGLFHNLRSTVLSRCIVASQTREKHCRDAILETLLPRKDFARVLVDVILKFYMSDWTALEVHKSL